VADSRVERANQAMADSEAGITIKPILRFETAAA
jgi:hypothetical protein